MSKLIKCLGGCGKSYERKGIHIMQAGKPVECHACHKVNVLERAKGHQQWKAAGMRARIEDEHNKVVEKVSNMFNDTSKLPKKESKKSLLDVDRVLLDMELERIVSSYEL